MANIHGIFFPPPGLGQLVRPLHAAPPGADTSKNKRKERKARQDERHGIK
jgi:hypothetical protein